MELSYSFYHIVCTLDLDKKNRSVTLLLLYDCVLLGKMFAEQVF